MDEQHRTISKGFVTTVFWVGIVVLVAFACAFSPIFVLQTVNVQGNRYVTSEDIMRIGGIQVGESMFSLNTAAIRQTLMKDLRIEQATVQRSLPGRLDISISERVPIAMIGCDYGYIEVGKDGIVLDAHRNLREMPVPIVSGVSAGDLFVGDVIADSQIKLVLQFLASLPEDTLAMLSEVSIADPDDVMVYAGSVQIRLGDLDELANKADVTESVINELKRTDRPIEYVDARFNVYSVRLRQ